MATAEQTVSAVLESTNKRYVVETGQTENGWFTRYSDGWIEQGGTNWTPTASIPTQTKITFPIEFRDTNYAIVATPWGGGPWGGSYAVGFSSDSKATTGCTYSSPGAGSSLGNAFDWRACGYAK